MRVFLCFVIVLWTVLPAAIVAAGNVPGETFGFEYSSGTMGSLSMFQAGVIFPKIGGSFSIELKARVASSMTWATFIDQRTGGSVSFHPVTAFGVATFGGCSPMIRDAFRMYGAADLLLGYSFTPYDSLIYGTGNLIGENLTFGVGGYFGVEVFTSSRISFFANGGGVFKSLSGDEGNLYVIASSWLGSGFSFQMGVRLYRRAGSERDSNAADASE